MEKKPHRQGDLLFVPRPDHRKINWGSKDPKKDPGFRKNGIIKEGEATGHHHRIEDPETANVFRPKGQRAVVEVLATHAKVVHPEHGTVTLDPDTTYDVHEAREHDLTAPNQMRYVAD